MFRYVIGWHQSIPVEFNLDCSVNTDDAPSDESSIDLRGDDLWAQEEKCDAPGFEDVE